MKLSELVYQAIKNVKYLEDSNFTYEAFLEGIYDDDQDYANSINNAMAPINEAVHRLSDRNKIAFRIASLGTPDNALVSLAPIMNSVKKIKSVFYLIDNSYVSVGWNEYNKEYVFVERVVKAPLFVQYIEDIKPFRMDSFKRPLEGYHKDGDVDLFSLGISETMCDYIIEYVQGKLQETIAPELANMHLTRAEQYFDDLEEQQYVFTQKKVTNKFRI